MKLAGALIALSLGAMAVMIFQTVQQELKLQNVKSKLLAGLSEVKRKEAAISELKGRVKQLKDSLSAINRDVVGLQTKKEVYDKIIKDKNLVVTTCNQKQEEAAKKRTETEAASVKLLDEHTKAKNAAEKEIQKLKEDILQRDKSVCAFADTTKEMARQLCGISVAAN